MLTVALRYAENFAPPCGTIAAHQELIDQYGFVWYGKLGAPVSAAVSRELLEQDSPRVLLIHSGSTDRFWAHISNISRELPERRYVPPYYRDKVSDFHCWLKVEKLVAAPRNVMARCFVRSSGKPLSVASRHSMSPYFIVDYTEE